MKIPLINTKEKYQIYDIYNLTMPVYTTNSGTFTVESALESNHLMISKDRSKYVILPDDEFKTCTNTAINFCTHKQVLYTTSFSKNCMLALSLGDRSKMNSMCQKYVTSHKDLTIVKHLLPGISIQQTS